MSGVALHYILCDEKTIVMNLRIFFIFYYTFIGHLLKERYHELAKEIEAAREMIYLMY